MSKVVDIHDQFNTLLASTLAGYRELPDSIDFEDNSNIDLDKGYTVAFASAINASDNFCKGDVRVQRTFTVMLSNGYIADLNATARNTLEKALMDDHFAVLSAFECNPTLNANAISVRYESDNGVEYLTDDRKQFIFIVSDFLVDYIERVS